MAFQRKRPDKPVTPDEALRKLENFCAYRERCPKEVRTRLAELGMRGEEGDQIFEVLRNDGFFDEERFAIAFAGGKFRINHWGKVRIRIELRMRDISPEVLERALDAIGEEEYQALLEQLWDKKKQQYEGDESARDKAIGALIRAGFEQPLFFQLARTQRSQEERQ